MVHITNLPVVWPVTELVVELGQYDAQVFCWTRSSVESKECGLSSKYLLGLEDQVVVSKLD
jgi:hypothetical protein